MRGNHFLLLWMFLKLETGVRRIEICSWLADWRYLHCTLFSSLLLLLRKLDLLEAVAKLQQKWEANLLVCVRFKLPNLRSGVSSGEVASDDAFVLEVTTHFNPLSPFP